MQLNLSCLTFGVPEKICNFAVLPWRITDWINPTGFDEYVRRLAAGEIEPMQEVLKGLHW